MEFNENWMAYLVYQKEVGQEGTPHYQGYIELKTQTRLPTILKRLPGCHVEPRRGTQAQAIEYCTKADTRDEGPWTHGTPKEQGKRSDLVALYECAKAGKRKRDVLDEMPAVYLRHYRAYAHAESLIKPRPLPRRVVLLYGGTETGKTRWAEDRYPDLWAAPLQKEMWFDGYDQHDTVLLDDFNGQMGLSLLLQLLDRYVRQVPVKGSFTWWNPSLIIVTSNFPVAEWYDYSTRQEHLLALERRFTEVHYFEVDKEPVQIKPKTDELSQPTASQEEYLNMCY